MCTAASLPACLIGCMPPLLLLLPGCLPADPRNRKAELSREFLNKHLVEARLSLRVGGRAGGWVGGWMGGWVGGWTGGWVGGRVGGWVGGWVGGRAGGRPAGGCWAVWWVASSHDNTRCGALPLPA